MSEVLARVVENLFLGTISCSSSNQLLRMIGMCVRALLPLAALLVCFANRCDDDDDVLQLASAIFFHFAHRVLHARVPSR